MKTNNYK